MISAREYADRRKRLDHKIEFLGMDAYLVSSRESIYYLTGASYIPEERPFFMLKLNLNKKLFLIPEKALPAIAGFLILS